MLAKIARSKKFTGKMYDFASKPRVQHPSGVKKSKEENFFDRLMDIRYLGQVVDFDPDGAFIGYDPNWIILARSIEKWIQTMKSDLAPILRIVLYSLINLQFGTWGVVIKSREATHSVYFSVAEAAQRAFKDQMVFPDPKGHLAFPIFYDKNTKTWDPVATSGDAPTVDELDIEGLKHKLLKAAEMKLGLDFARVEIGVGYFVFDDEFQIWIYHKKDSFQEDAVVMWENLSKDEDYFKRLMNVKYLGQVFAISDGEQILWDINEDTMVIIQSIEDWIKMINTKLENTFRLVIYSLFKTIAHSAFYINQAKETGEPVYFRLDELPHDVPGVENVDFLTTPVIFNDDDNHWTINGSDTPPTQAKIKPEELKSRLIQAARSKLGPNFENAQKGIGYVYIDKDETCHYAIAQDDNNVDPKSYVLWKNL